jgi:hypothetical protein
MLIGIYPQPGGRFLEPFCNYAIAQVARMQSILISFSVLFRVFRG